MKIEWTRIHFLGDVFRCCRLPRSPYVVKTPTSDTTDGLYGQ